MPDYWLLLAESHLTRRLFGPKNAQDGNVQPLRRSPSQFPKPFYIDFPPTLPLVP
jgi:hypothetical protein